MKYEMAAALTLVASASAFVAPSLPVRGHVASSSATSLKMSSERSKALPMLPRPPAVRILGISGCAGITDWLRRSDRVSLVKGTPLGLMSSVPFLLDGTMAGDVGFDPLGLSSISGLAGADLYWMREAELKHCRIAMLAVVGVLWCDQVGSVPGMPSGTNQMKLFWEVWAEKPAIIAAGFIFIGIIEIISGIATSMGQKNGDREPGDFGLDPLNLKDKPDLKARYQLNEIKNGRLAMWAAAGMIMQGVTTDQSALQNLFG